MNNYERRKQKLIKRFRSMRLEELEVLLDKPQAWWWRSEGFYSAISEVMQEKGSSHARHKEAAWDALMAAYQKSLAADTAATASAQNLRDDEGKRKHRAQRPVLRRAIAVAAVVQHWPSR